MKRRRCLSAALASLFLMTAAVPSASAGREISPPALSPGYQPSAATDEGGLWMMSDKAEREVQRSPLLVRDKALNDYVQGLVCKLAGPNCSAIRVYILNIPYFNANMAPNGAMQVWSGLLLRSKNEAQLSFVLAHEISHYLKRHTLNRYQSARDTSNAMAFLSLATGGIVGGIASLVAVGELSAYSRDQEREADAYGFDLVTAAGYDPREGAAIWEQVEAERKADPDEEEPDYFFASHPTSEERFETLSQKAAEIEKAMSGWKKGRETYLKAIKPFRGRWLEGELNRGKYAESKVLLDRLIKDDPQSSELRFYLGELYRRQGEDSAAMTAYKHAIDGEDTPTAAYRGLGLSALKMKEKTVARDAFNEYLAREPEADDRAMIEFYLSGL